jgi:hypothetical protein
MVFRVRDDSYLDVNRLFRDTVPTEVVQDSNTGENNIESAKVARMIYYQSKHIPLDF